MAGIPITTKFGVERAMRKVSRTPPEEIAKPSMEDIVYGYEAGKAKETLESKEFASRVGLEEKKLAETAREYNIGEAFNRDMLDTWKKQNNLATLIGIGTTALTGLSGYVALKQQEKRDVTAQETLDIYKGIGKTLKEVPAEVRAKQGGIIKTLSENLTPIPKLENYINDPYYLWGYNPPNNFGVGRR